MDFASWSDFTLKIFTIGILSTEVLFLCLRFFWRRAFGIVTYKDLDTVVNGFENVLKGFPDGFRAAWHVDDEGFAPDTGSAS